MQMVFSSQPGKVNDILRHLNRPRSGTWVETQIENKSLFGTKMKNGRLAGRRAACTPRFKKKTKAVANETQNATPEERKWAREFVDGMDDESTDDDAKEEVDAVDTNDVVPFFLDADEDEDADEEANARKRQKRIKRRDVNDTSDEE